MEVLFVGILSLIYEFCVEGEIMSTVLGKECYVLHIEKCEGEVQVEWIETGKVRYGDYKLYMYKDNELYFKESIENIYVNRFGNIALINTRDNKHRFEVVLKNNLTNGEVVDMRIINSLINKRVQSGDYVSCED
jgi:hypothetical protein